MGDQQLHRELPLGTAPREGTPPPDERVAGDQLARCHGEDADFVGLDPDAAIRKYRDAITGEGRREAGVERRSHGVILPPPNAAVQRRRADLTSAPRAHNEMSRLRRARDAVSPSAATACY